MADIFSETRYCLRCGHELSGPELEDGFCAVCGEPIPVDVEAEAEPEQETEGSQAPSDASPGSVEWILDGDFAVCPLCQASYDASEIPPVCERCHAEPRYSETIWALPAGEQNGQNLILVHQATGERIEITDGLVLGRALTPCLANDRYVSRRHAALHMKDGILTVQDVGSANGTRINGTPVQPHVETELRSGDTLTLDEQAFSVRKTD